MATGRTVPYAVPAYGDRSPIAADGPVGRKGDVINGDQACRGINGSSHPRTTTTGGMHANKIPVTAMATLGYTVTQGEVPDGDIATGDLEDASRIATANGNVVALAINHEVVVKRDGTQGRTERDGLVGQGSGKQDLHQAGMRCRMAGGISERDGSSIDPVVFIGSRVDYNRFAFDGA